MTNRERLAELAEGVSPPSGWTAETFEREEFERIRTTLFTAVVCESIPRRLGKDADAVSLALDKRLARKIANAYRSLWMAYAAGLGAPPAPKWTGRGERLALSREAEPELRRAGATIRWPAWLPARHDELVERRTQVAAFALGEGLSRWGSRRVRVLSDEIDNVERITREVAGIARRRRDGE